MKILISIFFTAIFLLGFAQQEARSVDLSKSSVNWIGKKVTGEHNGTIALKEAKLFFKDSYLVDGSFVLDMKSIACIDLGDAMANKLESHLKSEDFFDVNAFNESKLEFVKVKHIEGNSYLVVADLTIKGITHPIEFATNVKTHEAIATLEVDRTLYDVRYGSTSFFDNIGDKAIDDIFEIKVNLAY